MKNRLAIFDMDGTLFDTKDVNFNAYSEAIKECGFCVDLDYKYYCDFCNGNSYKDFLPKIIKNISNEDMEKIHQKKKNVYSKYLHFSRKNEHLFAIIDSIKDKYIVALVTTASRKNTMDILKAFGVDDCFDMILTQEDVSETKPAPECFIKAMQLAGVKEKDTLIFEDSESGLEAAGLSGANYIKVYGYN